MNIHSHYYQEKLDKNKTSVTSTCDLKLGSDDTVVVYTGNFYTSYSRIGAQLSVTFFHELVIDKVTGDINITYKIENKKKVGGDTLKEGLWTKKNDFNKIEDLCDRGFYLGEKRIGYWGVKYKRQIDDNFNFIKKELFSMTDDEFILNKSYNEEDCMVSPLYDLLVDFHLSKKKIKYHDNVYIHIQNDYPKKKWLKLNDNKFLPAVLDSYGIKSKYLIKELSQKHNQKINIKCVNYICKLLGDNHIDYIKKFLWEAVCKVHFKPSKIHKCKTDMEKNFIVNVINLWQYGDARLDNPIEALYNLYSLRSFLEEKGYDLKIKVRKPDDIDFLIEEWSLIKKHLSVGYKLKYVIPDEILEDVESPITIDEKVYIPKLILSEDDFTLEGAKMKNCMSKQFLHGSIYLYVSLSLGNRRINIQYRKGSLVQAFGKANTPIRKDIFDSALEVLSKRMLSHKELTWKKEKYEIISN